MTHRSGFVNIIGSPNVGKSTLMNELVGEKLSIITSKAQTTRHRVFGIVNRPEYQIVFSDTPGLVNAAYKLHEHMMSYVKTALKDADILIFMTDGKEQKTNHEPTLETIRKMDHIPVLLLINKIDLHQQDHVMERIAYWQEQVPHAEVIPVSALHKFNIESVYERIIELLPEGPPYFDKDQLTDRPLRFFVSEIIREKIFQHYEKEIPYSTEVLVESYKEEEGLVRIRALIMVERDSQKNIIIGKGGSMLKRVGTEARKDIEAFIGQKVYLETFVKVDKGWRSKENRLKYYGYTE
ncbi:MAG: GTPase Era [Flavobacteriales bacterium]|nr:GTPase Era [Flavobacteriales bacterium]